MASAQLTTQVQMPVSFSKCELCEENDVAWKCLECDELMCDYCKTSHVRSRATQKHAVVSMDNVERLPKNVKHWDVNCDRHPSHSIERYCDQCGQIVCIKCIADGQHIDHTFSTIKDIMEHKKKELSEMTTQTKLTLTSCEKAMRMLRKNQNEFSDCISKCIVEIKTRNSELKEKLDKITDVFITNLQVLEKNATENTKTKDDALKKRILSLKNLVEKCEEHLKKQEIDMIQFVTDVKQQLDKCEPCDPPEPIKCPGFIHKDVDDMDIMEIFGHLDRTEFHNLPQVLESSDRNDGVLNKDINVINCFTVKGRNILATANEDQLWMGRYGFKGISLLTMYGDVVKTVNTNFDVYDLAITKSGDVLSTVSKGDKVKKLMPDNTFIDLYTAPRKHLTRGITVTDDDNIVVCLYDKNRKEGKLVELSTDGELVKIIQYQSDGSTPLLKDTCSVSSNRNGDLIVVNYCDKSVVVIDKTLNKRFTYTGQVQGMKKPLNLWEAVTDQYGCIMISDCNNHVIHVLDENGHFLKYIRTDGHFVEKPQGMCIDKIGRLWVCSEYSDKVMTIK